MFRKLVLAGFGFVAVATMAASPASAQYGPDISSSAPVVRTGEPFTITGSGFPADVEISLTLGVAGAQTTRAIPDEGVVLGVVRSAGDGTFAAEVTVPASADPGTYVIRAQYQDVAAETVIEVIGAVDGSGGTTPGTGGGAAGGGSGGGAPDGSGSSLPRTGAGVTPYTVIGASLLAAGGVLLLATRNRRFGAVAS